jgi:hypothetical protein
MTARVLSTGSAWSAVLITAILASTPMLAAEDVPETAAGDPYQEARVLFSDQLGGRRRDALVESFFLAGRGGQARGLDLSPMLVGFTQFLRQHGIPLRTEHDHRSNDAIGVSASFSIRRDLPAVRFEAGDPIESFGAFYAQGFRCAFVWPVRNLSLRLEAGEDSELGYFAVAGTQWEHRKRPLALGFGIPMNLRDARGDVGLILQLRMKLN